MQEGTARKSGDRHARANAAQSAFAALDLGTNNCRLLIATGDSHGSPAPGKGAPTLKVVDSFSRIVRLGEGVSATGKLSDAAMDRTLVALGQCQRKLERHQIMRSRFVATEACRRANNTTQFLRRVKDETGIDIDVISSEEEARLAFLGCSSLLTQHSKRAIVFDIGGGSTELMWIDVEDEAGGRSITDWLSIDSGVMNLADRFGGHAFAEIAFDDMVAYIVDRLQPFDEANQISETIGAAPVQLLSTSGTVTTLAAIHLELPKYDRTRIDGITLNLSDISATVRKLLGMRPSERFHHPCIGADRSDFIIAGCAIFEAISSIWPTGQITIADRGVREGIIISLMQHHD